MNVQPADMLMVSIISSNIAPDARAAYEISSYDMRFRYKSLSDDVLKSIRRVADTLGFELVEKEKPATDTAQSADILSTAGEHLQNGSPAPQDIDAARDDYSAGLSGRAA
jgi:hypothetical protein